MTSVPTDPALQVEGFFDTATCTVTWLVLDPATRQCALVDSVLDYDAKSGRTSSAGAERLLARVADLGATVQWLLETHLHADHLSAAHWIQARVGGTIGIGRRIVDVQRVFGQLFNAGPGFVPGGREPCFATTVADQRAHDIHVHDGVTEAAFVAMRDARDATLPKPRLLLPSVQVNMRGGALPEPEGNGVRYLKIPLDTL